MKRTSMYTAVLALSLAMALAGGGLACRTFRERLDALEEQAVLQHQRNVCGLEDAFAAEYDTRSGAGYPSSGADSVCARVGQAYTRGQWLILGSSTAAFALLREGNVAYSALPESVAAADVQQASAATDGILLRGETLLLGGVLNTPYSYPVAVVTAADASEAFAARNRLLYSWLAVQAVITLAALVAAYHYERLQELNARQSRFVADLTHELKTPLTSLIGYADLLRGGTLDAERRRTAAEALYHESARLESLSQQLLALNGLQADGVVLRPVRVAAAFADAGCGAGLRRARGGRCAGGPGAAGGPCAQSGAECMARRAAGRCGPPALHRRGRMLAADRAGHGLRHPGGGAAPPDRAVLPRGQGPRPGQRRQRRGAGALRTNCRGIRHADDLCKPCGRGHDSDDFIAEGGRA